MDYKKAQVIDLDGFLINPYVLVCENPESPETDALTIIGYTLKSGETLLFETMPMLRIDASSQFGFIKPNWNDGGWVEGATEEEIAQWEIDNPAPEPVEPVPTVWDEMAAAIQEGVNEV